MNTKDLDLEIYNRPLQDGKKYLARVVGICNLGHRKETTFFKDQIPRIVPQVLLSFEFIDERTYISSNKPLILHRLTMLSPHPKRLFHKMSMSLNPDAFTSTTEDVCSDSVLEDDEGLGQHTTYEIDTSKLLYSLTEVTVGESKRTSGHFFIRRIEEPSPMQKYLSQECPITTPWLYDLVEDNLIQGNREDLPKGILKHALESMV